MHNSPSEPITEDVVLAALRDCYDMQIGANVVELGLVHSIEIIPDREAPGSGISGVPPRSRVTVGLLPPGFGSERESQIVAVIQNRMAAFPGISRTHVEVLSDPLWSLDRVAPELRRRLSAAVASNQRSDVLIQIQTALEKDGSAS